MTATLDKLNRRLVLATQEGLPIVREPYHALARELGVSAEAVMDRLRAMLAAGVIRRIGAVPNHYRLGFVANGMTVWEVPEDRIDAAGQLVGGLDYVSHCYRRPPHPPAWPYTLFAMVHGRDRASVEDRVAEIASLLGPMSRSHEVLYSARILKKTGLRLIA